MEPKFNKTWPAQNFGKVLMAFDEIKKKDVDKDDKAVTEQIMGPEARHRDAEDSVKSRGLWSREDEEDALRSCLAFILIFSIYFVPIVSIFHLKFKMQLGGGYENASLFGK